MFLVHGISNLIFTLVISVLIEMVEKAHGKSSTFFAHILRLRGKIVLSLFAENNLTYVDGVWSCGRRKRMLGQSGLLVLTFGACPVIWLWLI
ncbi:MAG: hypothetical protein VYE62_09250 [Pseudomonadota bacterium]|nr:hypothetical protein [Pseudomonadota bacterium]